MSAPNHSAGSQPAAPKQQLTLFDSTCIIVGIIIGAGIYESTPAIAQHVPGLGWLVAVWLLGGLCSLIGALCYAELATAWPEEGGDYVYLTRAFGHSAGFLFAWAQLWIVRPGSIGAMAYVFARYFDRLLPLSQYLAGAYRSLAPAGVAADKLLKTSQQFGDSLSLLIYAAGAVVVFSLINIAGVREGKWTQNLLTTAKVLGLGGIFVAGMFFADRQPAAEQPPAEPGAALDHAGRAERFETPEASRTAQAAQGADAGRRFGVSRAGELVQIPPEALPAEAAHTAPPAAAADLASQSESAAAPAATPQAAGAESGGFTLGLFGLAMIFVLYTYGGWNEMAYVGAEVRNPKKNILRALLLGTVAVTVIYVLITLAFVNSLGMEGTREPKTTVAEDVLQPLADRLFRLSEKRRALEEELGKLNAVLGGAAVAGPEGAAAEPPAVGARPEAAVAKRRAAIQQELAWLDRLGRLPGVGLCVLICISALGAVNGLVFTGARIYYAMGRDHRMYSWLGRWSARRGTPIASLVIQGVITLGLVVGFGLLKVAGLSEGGFHSMVIFTTPAFWFFLVLVGLAVGELRWREPARERPFRVPLYPLTPVLFCLSSLFMLYSSVDYAFKNRSAEVLWCVVMLVVGLGACFWDLTARRGAAAGQTE